MPMRVIKEDTEGIFISGYQNKYRPGKITGWSHAYNMSACGLQRGYRVNASYVDGTDMIRIKLEDGKKLIWGGSEARRIEALREK